jgi:hypothetical protein
VALLRFGGMGHTAVIHSRDDARTREYALRVPAMRVLVNTPAPMGSIGITTNLFPAMTLGCGAVAGNITSDNVGPQHLINIKRLAYAARRPEETFEMPLDYNAAPTAASATAPIAVDRASLVAAVERYLASRGVRTQPAAANAVSSVTSVVDRFLASRGGTTPAAAPPAVSGVLAVVDRYMASRGGMRPPAGSAVTPVKAVAPNVAAAVDRYLAARAVAPATAVVPSVSASVVDLFLSRRGAPSSTAAPASVPASVPQTGFG